MMQLPHTPSLRLDGRRALVVGASRGIGFACVVALAEAGANVLCAARNLASLEEVVAAMRSGGLSAEPLVLDVDDAGSVEAIVERAAPFDILVNSAGLARHGPLVEATVADFDAVVNVNLRGAYFIMQAVARCMIAAGKGGSIITISSQMGHVGGIDRTIYSATKHALEGLTKSAAIELGPHNIRVNTICPTFIRTPLSESTFRNPERLAWIKSKIKLPRVGEIEDVMGPVVFLASDAAAMITGTSLLIDGGWTAG
jgi:NAD(P)-dependent dehydrogenase (short-subunit alcohol dehydrogenase family)